ncbi:hypothetical protein [uncultured Psychromonas sp.]|uniref:hypothetical protein n=1 Tax=uncultured Psychromonas sp. TaxID=173974 RepID=UPI002626658D|nr:hypothetical protein [uncultured Psychromonas sp.]
MNKNIEQLLTLVASANDQLIEKHQQLSTTVGLLEQSLQASNAVTIDNIKLKQRLMFIILDANPEIVGVGTGKAGTEYFVFIEQYKLEELSVQMIVELMEQHILS